MMSKEVKNRMMKIERQKEREREKEGDDKRR